MATSPGDTPMGMNSSSGKPSARKSHRKTRTGCRTCKSRKIKCDEQRPSCNNCLRHSVQCDFLLTQSIEGSADSGQPSHGNIPPQHKPLVSSVASAYPRDASDPLNDLQGLSLNLKDLELLHNYVTVTSNTLHQSPAMKTLWKINVPQLGFEDDFVMRGILALSALHLAHFVPNKRDSYVQQAMTHHQIGLRIATSILTSVTKENCTSLYIFSVLTVFFSLARPRKAEDFFLVGDNGVADWFSLVKGVKFIVKTSREHLFSGTLGPMFQAGLRRTQRREAYMATASREGDPLAELQTFVESTHTDPQRLIIFVTAIELLRSTFMFFRTDTMPEESEIFTWVFFVPDQFLDLLHENSQEALAIFAFFCVALNRMDSNWWMTGWSTHLLSQIWKLLDEEHRLWIRWPIEDIGWIPPL